MKKDNDFGVDFRARTLNSPTIPGVTQKKFKPTYTHSSNVGGKEDLHTDVGSAMKAVHGKKGSWITRLKDQSIEYREGKETKKVAPAVQVGAGGEGSVKDKETNKNESFLVAAELREAWWCGTPALEAKKKKVTDTFTTNPPEKVNNWCGTGNTLEACIDEVTAKASKPKPKPVAKPVAKPASKPVSKPTAKPKAKSSSAKPEKSDDQRHADLLMKMAKVVTNSNAAGISPKHILAAGYAMHTFDTNVLATDPKAKSKPKHESVETIVDKFIEDTTTGDVGSIALGFAPTGEMDPHEGRPGPSKKKKKKNQFDRLSGMVSKNRYHKLTQKVAGAMPT
jgi:hypothetical protein